MKWVMLKWKNENEKMKKNPEYSIPTCPPPHLWVTFMIPILRSYRELAR